jgi:hypothetical protein
MSDAPEEVIARMRVENIKWILRPRGRRKIASHMVVSLMAAFFGSLLGIAAMLAVMRYHGIVCA